MSTLFVHLYGGPGTGKSTTAALVFGALKQAGRNVELVTEYAKDLTWEGAHGKLAFQPLVAAKQMWRDERLDGQVDAVITDTSPLLSLIYGDRGPEFRAWIDAEYARRETLNIFLRRDPSRAYNPAGRSQTEPEAQLADCEIRGLLRSLGLPFVQVEVDKDENSHVHAILRFISDRLDA